MLRGRVMVSTPPGVYPARGAVHLYRRPNLNKRIGKFLAGMSAASVGGIVALAWGTYGAQLRFIGQRLGTGIWGKLATSLLILGEASVPLYFAFNSTMHLLQQKLFEDVLLGKHAYLCSVNPTWHCIRPDSTHSSAHTVHHNTVKTFCPSGCCLQSKACTQSGKSAAASLKV